LIRMRQPFEYDRRYMAKCLLKEATLLEEVAQTCADEEASHRFRQLALRCNTLAVSKIIEQTETKSSH